MHIGDIVYYYDQYRSIIVKAEIIRMQDTMVALGKMRLIAGLRVISAVDTKYEPTSIYDWYSNKTSNDLYKTAKAAYEAYKENCHKQVENYCKEISTLEDLLAFPLSHSLCDSEWTDYEAVKAYTIRAKELTGIDLNEREK